MDFDFIFSFGAQPYDADAFMSKTNRSHGRHRYDTMRLYARPLHFSGQIVYIRHCANGTLKVVFFRQHLFNLQHVWLNAMRARAPCHALGFAMICVAVVERFAFAAKRKRRNNQIHYLNGYCKLNWRFIADFCSLSFR